jgi:hypothetical protein
LIGGWKSWVGRREGRWPQKDAKRGKKKRPEGDRQRGRKKRGEVGDGFVTVEGREWREAAWERERER